jgi:hypothetical protein
MLYLGKLEHDRRPCDVIQVRSEGWVEFIDLIFLDDRGVIVKWVSSFADGGRTITMTEEVTSYALNPDLRPEQFVYKPRDGARLIDADDERKRDKENLDAYWAREKQELEAHLLPVGARAPDFTVPDTDGRPLTLAGLLHRKKALVLHLWCFG